MKAWDSLFHKRIESIRQELDTYLKERYCGEESEEVCCSGLPGSRQSEEAVCLSAMVFSESAAEPREVYIPEFLKTKRGNRDIDRILEQREESFSSMLLRLIDEKGLKDSEVYKRANIDRRLFSKIRGDEEYVPSKKTAIAFCMALHLEPEEAKKLLAAAGYTLSASSRFDLIVKYLMEKNEYNVHFANIVLEDYGEGTLSR